MAVVSRAWAPRLAGLGFALVLAAGVALFVAIAARMMAWPHEVIVTEGAIGLAVRSILDGVGLYDPVRWMEPPYVIVHYTPLYYLVSAAWTALSGGGLFAGRTVSCLATASTAVLAGLYLRRRTGRTGPALVAAALWLSFYQVVFWGTTQRVDALGTLFEATGLLVFARQRGRGKNGYAALPWFVLAWCTKQVMIVGLLAAALELSRERRPAALRFLALGGGAIALVFGFLLAISGGGFWTAAVLGTVSADADPPWVIFSNAELFFASPWNLSLFCVAVCAAALRRRRPAAGADWDDRMLLGAYTVLGLVIAIATDANLPRFFPPMLGMALLVAGAVHRLARAPRLRTALLGTLTLFGGAHLAYEMRPLARERLLTLTHDCERLRFAAAVARHTSPAGEVLAQDVGMLLSAGRPVTVADPYVTSILAGNSAWRPDALEDGIRRQRFEAVVLNRPLEGLNDREWTTLWISPARAALAENYRLAEVVEIDATWRFLEPRRYIYVPR